MADLKQNLKHLKRDVEKIHEFVEHLNAHSGICTELIQESNIREASELFEHLQQIDKRIHEVQKHIVHIKNHIEQDSTIKTEIESLDIDDLKRDASHTSNDMKDIHSNVEHLITHANMCQDLINTSAETELERIKQHLSEIDEKAYELLEHIKDIRGEISLKYSEFIWPIPEGLDKYLQPTQLIDSKEPKVTEMALKLVDGMDSMQMAVISIFCYVRDYISQNIIEITTPNPASETLAAKTGGGIDKSILACALVRSVGIPSRIHFWRASKEYWMKNLSEYIDEIQMDEFSIATPEFIIESKWMTANDLIDKEFNISELHERFSELGIIKCEPVIDISKWNQIPIADLHDDETYAEPIKYLSSKKFSKQPLEAQKRVFAGFMYTGALEF